MSNVNRYFVEIEAPNRRALVDLWKMWLDLFRHSTAATFITESVLTGGAPVNTVTGASPKSFEFV